jgi:hypothetical protein
VNDILDITELLRRKERLRRELAALPFEEKMKMVMRMRERARLMKEAAARNDDEPARKSDRTTEPK